MPVLKLLGGLGGGCLGLLIALTLIIGISGLFWGWPIMLIAGACGWHIGYIPAAWGLGCAASLVLG